jgi:regulatory protein YycI of two-component signal transduction system YycFG
MLTLILLFVFIVIVVFTATYFNRKGKNEQIDIVINENSECCGAHEICDRESLQIIDTKIEYFDDEELDKLAGISPDDFSKRQVDTVSDVFYSMKENDVAPWLRSLQLRNIQLPDFLREEAMMIVAERR